MLGVKHPVEIFTGGDGWTHAVPAGQNWQFRTTLCGRENPVLGWPDNADESEPKQMLRRSHAGQCRTAILHAIDEQKDREKALERAKVDAD